MLLGPFADAHIAELRRRRARPVRAPAGTRPTPTSIDWVTGQAAVPPEERHAGPAQALGVPRDVLMAPLSLKAGRHRPQGRTAGPSPASPEGADALVLAELAATTGGQRHPACRARRRAAGAAGRRRCAFFAPEREVLALPGLGLPALRPGVAPSRHRQPSGSTTLSRLAAPSSRRSPARVVLTTVGGRPAAGAAAQPLSEAARRAEARARRSTLRWLTRFLGAQRLWPRRARCMEPGEFAVRGGIVDLFPPGADEPRAPRLVRRRARGRSAASTR